MAAARPSAAKSPTTGAPANTSASAGTGAPSAAAAAAAMSFNYPNMAAPNETQYLAILQNNGYPFPIPTANYRGPPGQAMPLFNGSFYSPQMIHPSQLQHHSQLQAAAAQQNASASSGSSSQKHVHSQQQRSHSSAVNSGSGSTSLQNQKTQPSHQQLQQSHNQQYVHPSRPRHFEGEPGGEDSPSTTDNRGARASMTIYGQNFAMPIHPQNFALMTAPAALASAAAAASANNNNNNNNNTSAGTGSNQIDKKAHQPHHQQGSKNGVDSLPSHGFAMSFGPMSGTGQGIDMASMAQNHQAMFQGSQEATRQNIQMMAAAAVATQVAHKKSFRISDDGGKSGGSDSPNRDDERKVGLAGKAQSIAFTRSDVGDSTVISSIQANNSVTENSARSLNVASGSAHSSRPMVTTTNVMAGMNVQNSHFQQQMLQHQLKQQQQQQQQLQMAANAVNRSKVPVTSNGSMYPDQLNSSSTTAAKFPNALSGFQQNHVQGNSSSSPSQSPQWKSSTRAPSSSLAPPVATTLKNLPQQHSRTTQPQMHTQISFGGNQKPSGNSQGQAPPNSNQAAPSSPMMVGSPTTSSMSKGANGSPRTASSASTNNKMGQGSSLSAQVPKNSTSVIPSQKSPSILGNPHHISSSGVGAKNQMQQQQQQKNMQQAQLFFSGPYAQSQSPHSNSNSSTTSGPGPYYTQQRRRQDQHQQAPGAPQVTSSTNDPAMAIAAATSNVKGGVLPSQGMIHALLPAGFTYVHPVPAAAVQAKPAEQKQAAG